MYVYAYMYILRAGKEHVEVGLTDLQDGHIILRVEERVGVGLTDLQDWATEGDVEEVLHRGAQGAPPDTTNLTRPPKAAFTVFRTVRSMTGLNCIRNTEASACAHSAVRKLCN